MLKRKSKKPVKEEIKPVKDVFKSKIIIGDLTELYDEGKSIIGFEDMEYEVHVILQDCIKKINNCKKDHGY
jgi:hypothetical protein|tara:strand:+ start:4669 stop:4881 length:213 start_codon:yes stop_codon:yes gene_type:complete